MEGGAGVAGEGIVGGLFVFLPLPFDGQGGFILGPDGDGGATAAGEVASG